jgi:hypothetical protein
VTEDPFAALGLAARRDLTDEDVRAAWRRIAAATHPDRDDGGDPGTFGAAAAAYDTLRTSYGRGEALADLGLHGPPGHAGRSGHAGQAVRAGHAGHAGRLGRWRLRRGTHRHRAGARHPGSAGRALSGRARAALSWRRLAARAAGAVVVAGVAVALVGWTPATIALVAGAATWLLARRGVLRGRAGGHGAGGVSDPVGPRADVEGGGDAGHRKGEDLVGRRHA